MGSDPLTAACKVTVCPASAVKSSTFFTKVGGSSQRKRVYTKCIIPKHFPPHIYLNVLSRLHLSCPICYSILLVN